MYLFSRPRLGYLFCRHRWPKLSYIILNRPKWPRLSYIPCRRRWPMLCT
jgi:hypothetical protein